MKNSMPTLLTLRDRFVQMKEEQFALKALRVHRAIGMEVALLLANTLVIRPCHDYNLLDNQAETQISYTTIKLPAITLPQRRISGTLS